jgi:aspartate kinase
MTIVAKFGGSSLADAMQFNRVRTIVAANPQRQYIVPSAPGRRDPGDTKVTDLLLECHKGLHDGTFNKTFSKVAQRFTDIGTDIGLAALTNQLLHETYYDIQTRNSIDFTASRGEYLNGKLLAAFLDTPFIDASRLILFNTDGTLALKETYAAIESQVRTTPRAVIPGFYGEDTHGNTHTLGRSGSDTTGSLIAAAIRADLYENWSDVDGLSIADPRIIPESKTIATITYREFNELSFRGNELLHDKSIFPVKRAGIPINIRNTNNPNHPGTMVVPKYNGTKPHYDITSIAGSKGFTALTIQKEEMDPAVGFVHDILNVFVQYNIPFRHMPAERDDVTIIFPTPHDTTVLDQLQIDIRHVHNPDSVTYDHNLAVISTIGEGIGGNPRVMVRYWGALAKANITKLRGGDFGAGNQLTINIALPEAQYETAIRAIYQEFVGK